MTQPHTLVALVTVIALLVYLGTSMNVARNRRRHGVEPPAMTGAPEVERALRVQGNTLEWLVIFLPALWLFALYWNNLVAAAIGALWIVGRIFYAVGYMKAAKARYPGFGIQATATFILLIGALVGVVRTLMVTGGV